MTATGVTSEDIQQLIRFLPGFEQPDRRFIERWGGGKPGADGTTTSPYPMYAADVEEFFRRAAQDPWCDNGYDPVAAARMVGDDDLIASASLRDIRTMLTYCVRGERFCDGHWGAMLDSGRITAILRRLKQLGEDS